MTAEEEAWLRLSLRLRKTPSELMHQVTWVDFLRYQQLFEDEVNVPDKRDWYAAQIAYETFCIPYRVWGKQPPARIEVKSFLMKFGKPDPTSRQAIDEETEQDIVENYSKMEMLKWSLSMGISPPGKEQPEDDASPVLTRLPPDMQGRVPAVKEAGLPAASPAPTTSPGVPVGFTPRGRGMRGKRGH